MRNYTGKVSPVRRTPEGLIVLSGTFPLVDTYGIPIEIMLEVLLSRGHIPDWIDFYEAAISVGWKPSSTQTKLSEAVCDVFGSTFRDGWNKRFQEYLDLKGSGQTSDV